MAAVAALAEVHQALQWIGFGNQVHHDSICEEADFESLKDFVGLSEKYIREMADGYEKRTQAQGHTPFGLRCIKLLIGVMHWVQDQDCCHRNASTGNIADVNEFREIIDISIQRAALQKVEDDQVDTISKAADHACPTRTLQWRGQRSRRIATAEQMREGLHYKNERSLAFSIFLDQMQKMFNIYEEEGEEFTEN